MHFFVLKALLILTLPLSAMLLIMALGLIIMRRNHLFGKSLVATSLVVLYLLSLSPVANALIRPLEARFKSLDKNYFSGIDYVLVLGGGVVDLSWLSLESSPSSASLKRLVHGICLYRKLTGSKLILSGGSGNPEKPELVEAEAMKRVAISLGITPEDIIVEGRSRNTLQSVEFLKEHIEGKKVLLVTSANHMGRALAMFKKKGLYPVPAPADYVSEYFNISFFSFIPKVGNLEKSTTAIYEYLGLSWYSLKGVI